MDGEQRCAFYETLRIGDEASLYKMTIGGYSGTIYDNLRYCNGIRFMTFDNDSFSTASTYHSGWWYCYSYCNLNGIMQEWSSYHTTAYWHHFRNREALRKIKMTLILKKNV